MSIAVNPKTKARLTEKSLASMSEAELKEIEREVGREYCAACFTDAVRTGAVDPEGKSEEELKLLLLQYARGHLDAIRNAGEVTWVIDHTRDLLQSARKFKRRHEHEQALLMYATWAEHWINSLIATASQRSKLSQEDLECMIRETSFRGKLTWLLRLLRLRPISQKHLSVTLRLAELRNGFVHYKWRGKSESAKAQQDTELAATIVQFEKTIRYLLRYETRHVLRNMRTYAEKFAHEVFSHGDTEPTEREGTVIESSSPDANLRDLPTEP